MRNAIGSTRTVIIYRTSLNVQTNVYGDFMRFQPRTNSSEPGVKCGSILLAQHMYTLTWYPSRAKSRDSFLNLSEERTPISSERTAGVFFRLSNFWCLMSLKSEQHDLSTQRGCLNEVYIFHHHWRPDTEGDGVGLSHAMEVAWKNIMSCDTWGRACLYYVESIRHSVTVANEGLQGFLD